MISKGKVKSQCCNRTITIHDFTSNCDGCGASVNPDNGAPFLIPETGLPHRCVY